MTAPARHLDTARPRPLAEETAVAMAYNGSTHAVMMATPDQVADLARGFTISEGIATSEEIGEIEVVAHPAGIEARIWLPKAREEALTARRRATVGPVGCGLCGIDSLEGAMRALPHLPRPTWHAGLGTLSEALIDLRRWQPLHDETRAVHGAGFWQPGQGIVAVREDVGRHNALDKLIGALAVKGIAGETGAVLLTSRVSVEMVQKSAILGAPLIAAVSAPTAHAVRLADAAGIAVAARGPAGLTAYCHPEIVEPHQ